ncbi:TrmH family RNA methyltransferase [archaeon]
MKALVTLARFVSPDEQKEIAKRISDMEYEVQSDPWAPQRRLIVSGKASGKLFEVEGVSQVIQIHAEEKTKTLSEAAKLIAETTKKLGLPSFTIRAKFLGDVPFHEKALRERVKKKAKNTPGRTLYIEAKKKADYVLIRVGLPELFHTEKSLPLVLVLESPKTPFEIADFLRLAIVFNVPLRISIEGDLRTLQALQEAKSIVKGHEKTKVMTYKTTLEAIKDRKAVALSLWGDKGEDFLKKEKVDALVFGNEERGLKLSTQKACAGVVHLGPRSSEPMRACQAAAYALGVMA